MKNTVNFTDYLNNSLKREPSLKSTSQLRLGLTVNAFHANSKTNKKHTRTKTDELCPAETMSTTSIFMQGKLKSYQQERKPRKKTQSELQLKKVISHKILEPQAPKSSSTVKPNPKQANPSTQTIRSLQKIRKNILNQSNPELAHEQLKQLNSTLHRKPTNPSSTSSITNQYYLLSSQLLETIKKMQRKHVEELRTQKEMYERREDKLMRKIVEVDKKNQRCVLLVNQLRMRNVDVDGVWHQEKLGVRVADQDKQ